MAGVGWWVCATALLHWFELDRWPTDLDAAPLERKYRSGIAKNDSILRPSVLKGVEKYSASIWQGPTYRRVSDRLPQSR
jgi:hypothetical protein